MNVVLSGYYGFHNVGDEAILLSIIEALRKERPGIGITVLSNDPEYTKETYSVNAVNRWSMGDVLQALRSSDGLISGGGSLLQDKTGLKSVPYYLGIMQMARLLNKPFFIYAQGLGPIEKAWNQKMTKQVLSKAAFVTVRDEESQALLKSFGFKKNIELVPDPVVGLDAEQFESTWLKEMGVTEPILAVSVRDWQTGQPYLKKVAKVLDNCADQGLKVLFVPMHDKQDAVTSEKTASYMKHDALIAPYDASIQEKIAFIKESDVLFGMRLHALIFAAVVSTPMVGLSYDPKIDSFMKQVNQPVGAHVDEDWLEVKMTQLILEQYRNKESESARLEKQVTDLKQQANQTAKLVIDSLA
ncbi:polysaccharide pyruvyl transferase CsaB [Bacillus tianshenii]|nr:polysaccharide pyruvyl transferase CsaB [Bacillus tianshenii]